MARPQGRLNANHAARRAELLALIEERLAWPDGHQAGMRALSAAAGVSYPTLRHYFGSRDGVVAALLEARGESGRPYLEKMMTTALPLSESIREVVSWLAEAGASAAFRALHDVGLREGIGQTATGTAYLEAIFEPTLQALESRLTLHIARGEMRETDPRMAGLTLLAPMLLGTLHQHSLSGHAVRPMALKDLGAHLHRTFIAAYAVPESG